MTSPLPTPEHSLVTAQSRALMNATINEVERRVLALGGEYRELGEESDKFPVTHHFVPGMYCREIFMPAGSLVTSYIHRHEHPFVVSHGECWVLGEDMLWHHVVAPHFGVTAAGTRRMLVNITDVVWTTFHVTNTTEVEAVEREIFIRPDNPFYPENAE